MGLQLYDYAGNPMAAGVQVMVYPAGVAQNPANLVASDWTRSGGLCPNISLNTAENYVATFVGRQGPIGQQAFSGGINDPTQVLVAQYASPSLSAAGHATVQGLWWPSGTGWWGAQARTPGFVAWATAFGIGSILANLDANAQNQLGAARVQSSQSSDIDSWAADFLGQWLLRYDQESDVSFLGRVYAVLASPKQTIQAIQAVVLAFYTAIALETGMQQNQNLTFGGQGGFGTWGGFGVSQGFLANIPSVYVWDRQSRPDLANQYNVNPYNDDGSFVIQIGVSPQNEDAWYLDFSSIDYETFLLNIGQYTLSTGAPDPRLAALVNFVKAGGTRPLYLTGIVGD